MTALYVAVATAGTLSEYNLDSGLLSNWQATLDAATLDTGLSSATSSSLSTSSTADTSTTTNGIQDSAAQTQSPASPNIISAPLAPTDGPILLNDPSYSTSTLSNWTIVTQDNNNPPFSGAYINGGTQLGLYANGGNGNAGNNPQSVAFHKFTTDGTLNGTVLALQVGQQFTVTLSLGSGGINGNSIGFALNNGTSFGGANNYNSGGRFEYSFTGGDSSAAIYDNTGKHQTNLPGFSSFAGGLTYTFTLVSTNEYTFSVSGGGATYNVQTLGGTANASIDSFALFNRGYNNADAFFSAISVGDLTFIPLTSNTGETKTVTGQITNNNGSANSIDKLGVGDVLLNNNNTFTGTTTVDAGNLKINNDATSTFGTLANTSGITINNGGTLSLTGSGTVTDRINNNAGLTVNTGGTFDLNSKSETIDALNGAGTITSSTNTSTSTLTTGGNNGGGTFSGVLQNGSGTLALQKNGSGTLTLSGTSNTFSGGIVISGGTLAASALGSLGSSSNTITLNNGGTFENTGAISLAAGNKLLLTTTASSTVTLQTDANLTTNSTTAIQNGSSTLTINKTGAGTLSLAGTTGSSYLGKWQITAGALSITADSNLGASTNNVTLNGGTFNWNAAADYAPTRIFTLNNVSGNTFADNASRTITFGTTNQLTGAGGFTFNGSGAILISASQNYQGTTTLSSGTLNINNSGAIGTGTLTLNGGTIDNTSSGALTLSTNNAQTWGGDFAFTGTRDLNLGTGAVSLGANAGTTRTVTVNGGNLTVGGVISDGTNGTTPTKNLTKAGGGTLVLTVANTYSGVTTISAGVLSVSSLANGGVASGIGQSNSNSTSLVINGGTLRYTGGAVSIDRKFQIGASGATIDASGSGALVFNATGTSAFSYGSPNNTARSLTLTGTNTGANTLSGILADNGTGQTSVTKSAGGTWVLAGANTYSGNTTVNGGTLLVNGSTSSTSAVAVNNSGSVLGGTGTINGTVNIASNGAILQGGNGTTGTTLILANSSLTLAAGSIIELALGAGGTHSTLGLTGSFNAFNANQTFNLDNFQTGTYQDIITGVASNINTSAWTINGQFGATYSFVDDNLGHIDLTVTAIPEPSAWMEAALALTALIGLERRQIARVMRLRR